MYMYTTKKPTISLRRTLISEDRVGVRSDAGECLEQSHEHLVVRAVLIVAQEPLKLLMNTHQNLQSMNRDRVNQQMYC